MTDAEKILWGFYCAVGGAVISLIARWAIEAITRYLQKRTNARYLAVRVVHELERFAAGCLAVADDPGPQQHNYQNFSAVKPPQFAPHDLKVEWTALDCMLVYDVLGLSSEKAAADHRLAQQAEDIHGDVWGMLEATCDEYVALGLSATGLATRLRAAVGLPAAKPDQEAALRAWAAKRKSLKARWAAKVMEFNSGN